MRTTMRVCIVRDKQVNSTATNITWNDVFENGNGSSAGSNANGITYASTAWTTYGFNTIGWAAQSQMTC